MTGVENNENEFNELYFKDAELNPSNFAVLLERWNSTKKVVVPKEDMLTCAKKVGQLTPDWILQQSLIIFKNKEYNKKMLIAIKTNDDFEVSIGGRLYDSIKIEAKHLGISVDEMTRFLTTSYKNRILRPP